METPRAGVTVMLPVAETRGSATDVARTVVEPALMPVTTPVVLLIVAMAGLVLVQTTACETPASASKVAVSVCASPVRIDALAGFT